MYLYILVAVVAIVMVKMLQWLRHRIRVENLSERYVFITGCDTGFGNLLTRALDSQGLHVFSGCLTERGATNLKEQCSGRLRCVLIDVTDKVSVEKAAMKVRSELPEGKGLWALVNNAGIMPNFCPSEWLSVENYRSVCNVNLFGTVSVTLAFLPMVRQARGRVVNVGSIVGFTALPGTTDYCISKAGVKMFTGCLRRELFRSGVSVHLIEPGGFATDITNLDRLRQLFEEAFHRLDDDVRAFYGGNIVTRAYKYFTLKNPPKLAQNPARVSTAMEDAVLSAHPRHNYLVGYDAHLLFKPLHLLPEWIGDYVFGWPAPYGPITFNFKSKSC